MELNERLEALRERRGISVRELARQLGGVSDTTVGRWMIGDAEPRLGEAVKLADFFGVSLCDLVGHPCAEPLPSDEQRVLDIYRTLRKTRGLDCEHAIAGLADAVAGLRGRDRA